MSVLQEVVMRKAIAFNGSPRMDKGFTALLLNSFARGMAEGGIEVELFHVGKLKIKPCSCGRLYCWNDVAGECCIKDDMQTLYPKLKAAEILVLATPVYIPLPGDMQNLMNRLCPLLDPVLEIRQERTRARFHTDVQLRQIVLVATSGWWELENMDVVVHIVKELAENASVNFAGSLLRPHSSIMKSKGKITEQGQAVLDAARCAGSELARDGKMDPFTLQGVSRPLISVEDYYRN